MTEFKIDGTTYQMLDSKFTFGEAAALERVTGHTFNEIMNDENVRGSIGVVQGLLWVSMKRARPELKFSDLNDMAIDDIEWVEADEPAEDEPVVPTQAGED